MSDYVKVLRCQRCERSFQTVDEFRHHIPCPQGEAAMFFCVTHPEDRFLAEIPAALVELVAEEFDEE